MVRTIGHIISSNIINIFFKFCFFVFFFCFMLDIEPRIFRETFQLQRHQPYAYQILMKKGLLGSLWNLMSFR